MANIITSQNYSREEKRRAYIEFWQEMAPYVTQAVGKSFVEANMTHPTQAEVKDRVNFLKKIVDEWRQDLKFSKFRIRDMLIHALRAHLLGIPFNPEPAKAAGGGREDGGMWAPNDPTPNIVTEVITPPNDATA